VSETGDRFATQEDNLDMVQRYLAAQSSSSVGAQSLTLPATNPAPSKTHLVEDKPRSRSKTLRADAQKYLRQLADVAVGEATIPDSLQSFVDTILNHSLEITTKLRAEQDRQSTELDASFEAIGACGATLSEALLPINSSDAKSLKHVAVSQKVALCKCRMEQAAMVADTQGCNDELACYKAIMEEKLAEKTAFLLDPNNAKPVEMFRNRITNESICKHSGGWLQEIGDTDADKASAWFDSQSKAWWEYWGAKKATLAALINSSAFATAIHDTLKDGTGLFLGRGCDMYNTLANTKAAECSELQVGATMSQCQYRAKKKKQM
jgi:hypothetical protein